jgi:ribosome recycling factor
MTEERRRDVVEAVNRSSDSATQIKCNLRGDVQASVRRSGCDTERQIESSLASADTEAVNHAGDKIKRVLRPSVERS